MGMEKNMKKLVSAAITAAAMASPAASIAATETDTFEVLLNLRASCTIDQATASHDGRNYLHQHRQRHLLQWCGFRYRPERHQWQP